MFDLGLDVGFFLSDGLWRRPDVSVEHPTLWRGADVRVAQRRRAHGVLDVVLHPVTPVINCRENNFLLSEMFQIAPNPVWGITQPS